MILRKLKRVHATPEQTAAVAEPLTPSVFGAVVDIRGFAFVVGVEAGCAVVGAVRFLALLGLGI